MKRETIVKKILEYVAENCIKEEEYGGRMEDWCFFCGRYQERKHKGEQHNKSCLALKARKLLNNGDK